MTSQNILIERWVIVLDGLDEVKGATAQTEIIYIVTISIYERSTPFWWFILSCPESYIQHEMGGDNVSFLLHSLDLLLSS